MEVDWVSATTKISGKVELVGMNIILASILIHNDLFIRSSIVLLLILDLGCVLVL